MTDLAAKQIENVPSSNVADRLLEYADDIESEGREYAPRYMREAALRLVALEQLAANWIYQQAAYPPSVEGQHAAAAVRLCAKELRAALKLETA